MLGRSMTYGADVSLLQTGPTRRAYSARNSVSGEDARSAARHIQQARDGPKIRVSEIRFRPRPWKRDNSLGRSEVAGRRGVARVFAGLPPLPPAFEGR